MTLKVPLRVAVNQAVSYGNPRAMNKKIAISAAVVIIAAAASSYASPYLTMHQMRSAIESGDADAFSSHVDFPALRESLKAQIMALFGKKMASATGEQANGFAALGMMMAVGLANSVIDTMVTPSGVMTMMAEGKTKPPAPGAAKQSNASSEVAPQKPVDYSVGYKDWSTVVATANQDGGEKGSFIFKRDGLWSWKLAAVHMPLDKVSSE